MLSTFPCDLILFVPLSTERYQERGFNQAEELARGVSSQIHRPALKGFVRIKNTDPLYNLSLEARKETIMNAFVLKKKPSKKLQNKRILLVDDIFTTGTTLAELAHLLLPLTSKIIFLTLTRALIADPLD